MADDQIRVAGHQGRQAVGGVAADHTVEDIVARLGRPVVPPLGEGPRGQGVDQRRPHRLPADRPRLADAQPRLAYLPHDLHGAFAKPLAVAGQPNGRGGAIDELRAQPRFQRLDPATEGGLRDIAQLRRAREIAGFRDGEKIFQPTSVHEGADPIARFERRHATRLRDLLAWGVKFDQGGGGGFWADAILIGGLVHEPARGLIHSVAQGPSGNASGGRRDHAAHPAQSHPDHVRRAEGPATRRHPGRPPLDRLPRRATLSADEPHRP